MFSVFKRLKLVFKSLIAPLRHLLNMDMLILSAWHRRVNRRDKLWFKNVHMLCVCNFTFNLFCFNPYFEPWQVKYHFFSKINICNTGCSWLWNFGIALQICKMEMSVHMLCVCNFTYRFTHGVCFQILNDKFFFFYKISICTM